MLIFLNSNNNKSKYIFLSIFKIDIFKKVKALKDFFIFVKLFTTTEIFS